jgi:hypothetical protein
MPITVVHSPSAGAIGDAAYTGAKLSTGAEALLRRRQFEEQQRQAALQNLFRGIGMTVDVINTNRANARADRAEAENNRRWEIARQDQQAKQQAEMQQAALEEEARLQREQMKAKSAIDLQQEKARAYAEKDRLAYEREKELMTGEAALKRGQLPPWQKKEVQRLEQEMQRIRLSPDLTAEERAFALGQLEQERSMYPEQTELSLQEKFNATIHWADDPNNPGKKVPFTFDENGMPMVPRGYTIGKSSDGGDGMLSRKDAISRSVEVRDTIMKQRQEQAKAIETQIRTMESDLQDYLMQVQDYSSQMSQGKLKPADYAAKVQELSTQANAVKAQIQALRPKLQELSAPVSDMEVAQRVVQDSMWEQRMGDALTGRGQLPPGMTPGVVPGPLASEQTMPEPPPPAQPQEPSRAAEYRRRSDELWATFDEEEKTRLQELSDEVENARSARDRFNAVLNLRAYLKEQGVDLGE